MARKSRAERHEAHRREVESHKQRLRRFMYEGHHIYAQEHYRKAVREGEHARAEAIEEMLGEISRHNREHPPAPNYGMDDGRERARDLERRRQEVRDNERAAGIAEGARRKASGIGGGLFATSESEPEMDEGPDQEAEEYEDRRRTLASHGLLSRTPAPPQQPRKKKRGYSYPPFVG